MPSLRQFVLLGLLWAAMSWLTTLLWSMAAHDHGIGAALRDYYAVRAPVVGALCGTIWSPVLCLGYLPGRASALAGRLPGLAVESATRVVFRVLQGAVMGQLVGTSATILLLFVWPNTMQNDRLDAIKWGLLFWKLYWYILPPAAAAAGMASVWIARHVRRRHHFGTLYL